MAADGKSRQLVFELEVVPSFDENDFLVSPANAAAHAGILRWPEWPARNLLLVGPAGSGKSHLAALWAARAQARTTRKGDRLDPESSHAAELIEDCDRAGYSEPDFFHLLNLAAAREAWLLLTARAIPDRWTLRTPDLLSRLRLAPVFEIGRPDEMLMRAVLVKLFCDRQIRIDDDVVNYAARHCEQSLEAATRFVEAVDEAALAAGRRITRPLAAEIIADLGNDRSDYGPT